MDWDESFRDVHPRRGVYAAMNPPDFNQFSNLLGPLDGETRARLMALLQQPSEETWDEARSIILNQERMLTLWQAVLKVDPSFGSAQAPVTRWVDSPGHANGLGGYSEPVSGWSHIPSPDTIVQALRYAAG